MSQLGRPLLILALLVGLAVRPRNAAATAGTLAAA
jgi:hypothetical protein